MSANTPIDSAGHVRLGEAVRHRREQLGLTMDDVASRARVSRSSIHRLEHGAPFRPTPSKLGRILQVVGITADEVVALLPDDEYRGDILHWLGREPAASLTQAMGAVAAVAHPDLLAMHPDGAVARIQINSGHSDELAAVLKAAGWTVSRPV